MTCTICSIRKVELKRTVEQFLEQNNGVLSSENKNALKAQFPDDVEVIDGINAQDCSIHWNFHQTITREAEANIVVKEGNNSTLAADVNKDEGFALYELLNNQAATFNCLSRKIDKTIEKAEDAKDIMFNPNVLQFYRDTADSIRATVRELKDLNTAVNGNGDSSLEGLKALAVALTVNKGPVSKEQQMTTDEYD